MTYPTQAYLHFGQGSESRLTISVPCRNKPLPCHIAGRQQSATGYGLKLASPAQVLWRNRWRRVYVCCISNASTAYIGKPGAWEAIVDYD